MRPVFRTYSRALLVGAALLGALAASGCEGGGGATDPTAASEAPADPFTFFRTRDALVRTDSSTGQVWFSALDGSGGWLDLGTPPESAGQPNRPGRYNLITVAAPQKPGAQTMARKQDLLLMRLDGATGRAWLAPIRRNASWEPIEDSATVAG